MIGKWCKCFFVTARFEWLIFTSFLAGWVFESFHVDFHDRQHSGVSSLDGVGPGNHQSLSWNKEAPVLCFGEESTVVLSHLDSLSFTWWILWYSLNQKSYRSQEWPVWLSTLLSDSECSSILWALLGRQGSWLHSNVQSSAPAEGSAARRSMHRWWQHPQAQCIDGDEGRIHKSSKYIQIPEVGMSRAIW